MTARRATASAASAVAAVLAAALLVLLLVTWAASIGPSGVLRGDGIRANHSAEPSPTVSTPTGTATRVGDVERLAQSRPDGVSPVIRTIAFLVEITTACLVLYLLFRFAGWLREVYDARRRRDPRAENVEFDVIEAPAAVVREILDGAAEQRQLLTEGVPGDAIIACWHQFEARAATAGMSRRAAETSSEFTLRILGLIDADRGAVARLGALYREARFSEHEMTEADRAAAVESLDVLHRGLLAPSGRGRS